MLVKQLQTWTETRTLFRLLKQKKETALIQGLSGSQRAFVLAALWEQLNQGMLIITNTPSEAERLASDLELILGEGLILVFPAYDLLAHEEAYEKEVAGERLAVLSTLNKDQKQLVITSWPALVRKVIPPGILNAFVINITVGEEIGKRDNFLNKLVMMGYERVDKVEIPGEFGVRGGIIDLFPLNHHEPLRIEFFGDEVDSIRGFDIETQKSIYKLDKVEILPAREGLWTNEEFKLAKEKIKTLLQIQAERLLKQKNTSGINESASFLQNRFAELLEKVENRMVFPGIDRFLPLIRSDLVPFWEYLTEGLVILDEPVRGREYLRALEEENARSIGGFLERGLILPQEIDLYLTLSDLQSSLAQNSILQISSLGKTLKGIEPDRNIVFPLRPAPDFIGQFSRLINDLRSRTNEQWRVILSVSGEERMENLKTSLRDEGFLITEILDGKDFSPGMIYISSAPLSTGLELPLGKLLILTENEIYGRVRRKKKVKTHFTKEGIRLSNVDELQFGDYVVHINHGIGKYVGIKKLEIDGANRDYLEIEYADRDRLFVPTDQVHFIQKYVGLEETPPKINRLGGGDWQKVKNRVKESIKEMADQLLVLYADRFTAKGYVFPPDTIWQKEFEEAFVYEETPDQIRATEEIKKDMESATPMDRLLCGDVGYGKTEVAMRAAFKAVIEGKQVAVLVPTTILAQQHFQTFTQRFTGYPVKIGVLSRFQSAAEQERVVKGLKNGTVDLVIGTHRLLSKDISFKDLGLLIVDEEQKFGVAHKERLKALKKNVDALTLTATPIPRTLHMSMIGIRDMSVIETPPEDRFPVRTYVIEFNEEVITEAIRRELDRGGQVFFVYNRVETIDRMANYLQQLIPEARIEIAHGQMNEDTLEEVMLGFYEGSADILICTTIIENGLDISNVNTLVVYDADRLGLSQLYQLRGRVGRSNRVAYAYFTYRKDKLLGEAAEKRLAAIRDFSDLGSGFKIALRDLEIRGAGNLLGPEQHGHIAAIGFDLYCKLLEEAIKERRGEKKPDTPDPTIELTVDAYIPENYISDPAQKVEIYKKIASISSLTEADEIEEEIIDRFGDPPEAVWNLMEIARIKVLAKHVGISSISSQRGDIVARFLPGLSQNAERVADLIIKYRGQVRYQSGKQLTIRWRTIGRNFSELWKLIKDSLLYLLGEKNSA